MKYFFVLMEVFILCIIMYHELLRMMQFFLCFWMGYLYQPKKYYKLS